MINWIIKPLNFGFKDNTNGAGLTATLPYLGFYLTDGKHKIMVDNGVTDDFVCKEIKDWGLPCEGGEDYVIKALNEIEVRPNDIDLMIYTHLHFDHVGNCHLFQKATHIFQDAEWKELVDPLPSMMSLRVFDQDVIPKFAKLKSQRVVGDVEILDGLNLIQVPGHSSGSQCLQVATKDGNYIIAGDLFHCNFMAYPEINTWTQMHNGKVVEFTQELKDWLRRLLFGIIFDHYAWYRSSYRILSMLRGPGFLVAGHEPSIIGKTFG